MVAVKLDENMPDAVADVLRSAGHDVALARDEDLAGSDDARLLEAAVTEGRVLMTLDLDFADFGSVVAVWVILSGENFPRFVTAFPGAKP